MRRIRRPAIATGVAVALALPLLGITPAAAAPAPDPAYRFVDCQAPAGGDGTVDSPLSSLQQVNELQLEPGDHVFFKRGSVCDGSLQPQGSGEAGAPIVMDAYGDAADEKPHIRGGGVEETILLHNQEYWELRNLQVSNIDSDPAEQYSHERRGVVIALEDFGQGDYYRVVGLDVHDVYGEGKKDLGGSGGIQLEVYANADEAQREKTWFNDVVIEDNTVENVNRSGINMSTAWKCRPENGWDGCPPADRQKLVWTPSTGLVIRGNTVKNVGGDGIVVQMNKDALVEHNVVSDVANRPNGSNAGVWAWNADGTVFQYNEVFDVKRLWDNNDGNAFDADYGTTETVFQYNYSHDNAGGMMLYCGCGGLATKVTFRYNVSENDQNRLNFVAGGTENAFYNNTIIVPDDEGFVINNTNANGTSLLMANNLLIATKNVADESQNYPGSNAITWRNNAFAGPVSGWPTSDDAVVIDETLPFAEGTGMDRFKITDPRLAGTGIPIAEPGTRDLFDNPVPSLCRPDIGAFQFSGSADDCGPDGSSIAAGDSLTEIKVAALKTYRVTSASGAVSVTNHNGFVTPRTETGTVFTTTMDATSVDLVCDQDEACEGVRLEVVENLVIDPSFEATSNTPWSNWNTSRTTELAVSGDRALRVTGPGSTEQRIVNVRPNTDYTLRGWAMSSSGSVQLGLKNFEGNQDPENPLQNQEYAGVSTSELSHAAVQFNSGESSTLIVYCYKPSAGTALCDDISLTADSSQARTALQPVDTTVREGHSATFAASFEGVDRGNVSWQERAGDQWTDIPGSTGYAFTRDAISSADDGAQFRAIVRGSEGPVVTEPATVHVIPAFAVAVITASPEDVSVDEGEAVRLVATASGQPAPSLQWQRSSDGDTWTDVDGATTTELALDDVTSDLDGAMFRMGAINPFGTVYSAAASVSVAAVEVPPVDGGGGGGTGGDSDAGGNGGAGQPDADGADLAITGAAVPIGIVVLAAALIAGGAALLRRRMIATRHHESS